MFFEFLLNVLECGTVEYLEQDGTLVKKFLEMIACQECLKGILLIALNVLNMFGRWLLRPASILDVLMFKR